MLENVYYMSCIVRYQAGNQKAGMQENYPLSSHG